ncbi:GNAT family N-acetyltransferase [Methylobacterium sp. J-076]|uniref:GNAT family N-acetyltransferase n=1 Tax=Methylobacterium sp. J-076 TaxID=2836655 RepID=UPI001FBA1EEA|nr:GNAT family N-acetyltransferase [Methylobacterium sp. J-076]MCJ2015113.1 GNAT family N-acetyltransferase [Methylobacterium sp. J-076]
MTGALTVTLHRDAAAAFAGLNPTAMAGYAFQTQAWLGCYAETIGRAAGEEPLLLVVAEDGVARMLVPLALSKRGLVRTVAFLGGRVTDYNAPLADPAFAARLAGPAMEGLWHAIRAALPPHDVLHLTRMPATLDPPAGVAGPVPNPFARLPGARPAGQAQGLSLTGSYETVCASFKTSFNARQRRSWRKLRDRGTVAFTVAETPDAMEPVLSALRSMKSRRWLETGNPDAFADPAFRAFYDRIALATLPEGRVHGDLMRIDDVPIAAHLGLVHRGRFYYLMLGWEAGEWRAFATGRLMLDAMLRWTCEQGLTTFDFTVGDEPYKQDWVDTDLPLFAYEAAASARGWATLSAEAARRGLRRRAKRIVWLRNAIRRLNGRQPLAPPAAPRERPTAPETPR